MASDSLGLAASVMQVTGIDAFGLVSMIAQAAHTARRNRDLCHQLSLHVQIVGDLLRKVDIPELRRHPETRRPLDQLDAVLLQAYNLVKSCSQQQRTTSQIYQMLTGGTVYSKLRQAQEQIDRYINLIPMITLAGVVNYSRQGKDEGDEDVSNDAASNQRARLSLQDVANSLPLEEAPPEGEMVGSTEENTHVVVVELPGVAGHRALLLGVQVLRRKA